MLSTTKTSLAILLAAVAAVSQVVCHTTDMTTTTTVAQTTTPLFTSEQLGVLVGIPVALAVIILIGVIIGCVVLHRVHQEDKLLNGKLFTGGDGAPGSAASTGARGNPAYYADYLNSSTKMQ